MKTTTSTFIHVNCYENESIAKSILYVLQIVFKNSGYRLVTLLLTRFKKKLIFNDKKWILITKEKKLFHTS